MNFPGRATGTETVSTLTSTETPAPDPDRGKALYKPGFRWRLETTQGVSDAGNSAWGAGDISDRGAEMLTRAQSGNAETGISRRL